MHRADDRLRDAVLTALRADPKLAGDQIFVTVDGGAATLYGRVRSDAEADRAEHIVLGVDGIVAVAQSMFISRRVRSCDSDIARIAARSLLESPDVPPGVSATVRDQILTLTGVVDSQRERAAACRAVRDIEEAQIIVNAITVHLEHPPVQWHPPVQHAV